MRVLISGSSGLIGSALVRELAANGHEVARLVRSSAAEPPHVSWDPDAGTIDQTRLEGFEVVVHLAGESVAARWTATKKAGIQSSRTKGTQLLAEALAHLASPPATLISASAIGYYGDGNDEVLTEQSAGGEGFLAGVCRDWEASAAPAFRAGIRVVHPRFGIVLSTDGGALPKMLIPFRLGLGGRIGDGTQYMSWISIHDTVAALLYLVANETISGPVNFVSPELVTNSQFTHTLAKVVRRPAVLPLPAFAARLALGREAADEMLLASQRVVPEILQRAGYKFRHPDLATALHELLVR